MLEETLLESGILLVGRDDWRRGRREWRNPGAGGAIILCSITQAKGLRCATLAFYPCFRISGSVVNAREIGSGLSWLDCGREWTM